MVGTDVSMIKPQHRRTNTGLRGALRRWWPTCKHRVGHSKREIEISKPLQTETVTLSLAYKQATINSTTMQGGYPPQGGQGGYPPQGGQGGYPPGGPPQGGFRPQGLRVAGILWGLLRTKAGGRSMNTGSKSNYASTARLLQGGASTINSSWRATAIPTPSGRSSTCMTML